MTELKLDCVYYGYSTCHADFRAGEQKVKVDFTEEEAAIIRDLAFQVWERNKAAAAEAILSATPLALAAPIDAEFEEVHDAQF